MKKKLTDKDKQDWLNFLESKDSIENKDKDFKRSKKNLIEKTIDLHGYSLDEANKVIFDFIEKCYLQGVNKINIITGKGSRSQNEKTHINPNILAF